MAGTTRGTGDPVSQRTSWFGPLRLAAVALLALLLPFIASATLVTVAGPRYFSTSGGGGGFTSDFPLQSVGYVSMVPGSSGFGYENYGGSGRDGATGRVTVVLINDFTAGTACDAVPGYTRIYEGNIQCCVSTAGPKACIPVAEGVIDLDSDVRLGSYVDYYGQFAPGIGVVWRNTYPSASISFCSSVATNQRIWHADLRVGDDAPGIPTPERDSASVGGCSDAGSPALSLIAYINGFIGWSVDELFDGYYCGDNLAFHANVIAEPLGKSIHDDQGTVDDGTGVEAHPYGPVLGPGYRCDRVSFQRNVFAHMQSRQPFISALRFAYANNIVYNPGDTDGNDADGLRLSNDYDAATPNTSAMNANIVRNLFIAGPDSTSTFRAITVDPNGTDPTTRLPAGSQGYIAGNAARGWTFANQLALKTGTFPSGFDAGAVISAATPAGWGADLSGLLAVGSTSDPNDPSDAEMTTFVTAICAHAGPRPSVTGASNRARTVCGHVLARLAGSGDEGQAANSVSGVSSPAGWPNIALRFSPNVGGYPSAGSSTVDVFDGTGTCTGVPMPLNGTAPDDRILATGTFSNGFSKAGYGTLEAWAFDEHLCKEAA